MIIYNCNDEESSKKILDKQNHDNQNKTYLLKCTRLEKVFCLVSDLFAIAENIKVNKLKVSEMGKQYDILRILCHTEKKEGTQIFPRFF